MSKVVQLWLAGLAIVISGCIGVGNDEPQLTQSAGNISSVCGNQWELKRLRLNGEVVGIERLSDFTFLCNNEGRVMGKSGINTYGGALQVTENGLLLWDTASFVSTKMAGPPPLMEQETTYLRALSGTRQAFTKSGDSRLILRDPSGNIYLEYVKSSP